MYPVRVRTSRAFACTAADVAVHGQSPGRRSGGQALSIVKVGASLNAPPTLF